MRYYTEGKYAKVITRFLTEVQERYWIKVMILVVKLTLSLLGKEWREVIWLFEEILLRWNV